MKPRSNWRRNNANGPFQGYTDAGLKILSWNAGGLSSPKFTELKIILKRENVDVFGIIEAGASTDCLKFYQLPDYNMYVLPRGRQIASGIIVGVKKSITVKFRILHEMHDNKFEAAELTAWKARRKCKIVFSYNPPNNQPLVELLENVLEENTVLLGDFNAPSTRWGYKVTKPAGVIMEDFIDTAPLELLQSDQPTFLSFKGETSNPDLAMVHIGLCSVASLKVLESCSGYGHRALLVIINEKQRYGKIKDSEPRWNFKKADWKKYANITDSKIIKNLIDPDNPDTSYNNLSKVIKECATQSMPRGSARQYKPFWNDTLDSLKRERDETRRIAERTQALRDTQELRKKQAVLKRAVLEAKRTWFKDFVANLDYKKDGVKAFRYLATLNNEEFKELNEPIITATGREIVDSQNKAKALAKHYAAVSRLPGKNKGFKTIPNIGCPSKDEDFYFYSPFSIAELRRAVAETKKGKCAGPDNIPIELLSNLGEKAKEILLHFLNSVWSTRVPAEWQKAEIIPLLKKDKPPSDPSSYRPISLTCACCKLMERMAINRLNSFLETNSKLTDSQAGFRKKRGTIEQVAYLTQWIKDGFQRKQSTVAVFVDFKAAYDTVWKPKLLEKLVKCGVKGNMLNWIKSFLAQRFARVKYLGRRSNYVQLRNGLPQGAVMSCTLFNVMINDLVESMNRVVGVKSLLFADDLVIFATSSNIPALAETLNKTLKYLEEWCDLNLMTVNLNKTACQLFTLSTKNHIFDLFYKNQKLHQEETVNYLGVTLDKKLLWRRHVEKIAKNAESRLRLLKRLSGITWGSSQEMLATTYKTYIRPVLEYGGELLSTASNSTVKVLDKVQNKALRVVTGAPKSTPIPAMEIQTSIEPLKFRRDKRVLKLAEKCLRLPVNHWKHHTPGVERLSTQTSFLSRAAHLKEEYGLVWQSRAAFIHEKASDLSVKIPELNLTVGSHERKSLELPASLKCLAMERLQSEYPKGSWTRIYTDGSADGGRKLAGAGFVIEDICEGMVALGNKCNNFDAEVEAVRQAADKLSTIASDKKKAVFLIDSQATICALGSCKPSHNTRVSEARQAVSDLIEDGWTIVYQWVPSHCNVEGNELADQAAKKASRLPQPEEPVTFEQATAEIDAKIDQALVDYQQERANGKDWESLLREKVPSILPRKEFTANFRMTTRHDYLQAHLFKIGIKDDPKCPLCNSSEDMNVEHLRRCPKLNNINCVNDDGVNKWRQNSLLYWAARKEMGLISQ